MDNRPRREPRIANVSDLTIDAIPGRLSSVGNRMLPIWMSAIFK